MSARAFDRAPKSTQTALPLSTESGLAVSTTADPMGTLDMLALTGTGTPPEEAR